MGAVANCTILPSGSIRASIPWRMDANSRSNRSCALSWIAYRRRMRILALGRPRRTTAHSPPRSTVILSPTCMLISFHDHSLLQSPKRSSGKALNFETLAQNLPRLAATRECPHLHSLAISRASTTSIIIAISSSESLRIVYLHKVWIRHRCLRPLDAAMCIFVQDSTSGEIRIHRLLPYPVW